MMSGWRPETEGIEFIPGEAMFFQVLLV